MKWFYLFSLCFVLSACTISFQNVSTNGKASDVVDEEQEATPNISPNIDLPLVK